MDKKNNLKILNNYFHAGTAEGDESFLVDAFVPFDEYINIISIPLGGPRILLGSKGSGKSALLRFFRSQMTEIDVPAILIRPKDISLSKKSDNSLGTLTRSCEAAILKAVAVKIGSGICGLVINTDDKKLLQLAKSDGSKDHDAIEKLSRILSPLGKSISGVDFSKMKLGITEVGHKSIRSSIESNLSRSGKCIYVLIDDTDQIASPNEPDHLNRIWAFLLAARSIMEECKNIKFIITLRDEVWRRLKRDNAGQRDQVDHFRNLAIKINLSEEIIKSILKKRLELAHKEIGVDPHLTLYNLFFETNHVQIPTAFEKFSYWDDFIVKRSRERPRDSIQLVYKLSDMALKQNNNQIQSGHVEKVMPVYSEERVDDLKIECELECPQIKEIVRAFSGLEYDEGSFTLHPQTTADFILKLPGRFSITLFGKALSNNDKDSVFDLWRFLHEVGFFNARVSDTRQRDGYRHVTAEDDPDLVSPARWHEMQAITWEIHPAYRDFIIKIVNEKKFSFGLPSKKKRKHR